MDKKNTMLLTVIAVATLLVAVVGATFAYFSVTGDQSATTNVTAKTPKIGTVSVSKSEGPYSLKLTAQDMMKSDSSDIKYYVIKSSNTQDNQGASIGGIYSKVEKEFDIATISLSGAEDSDTVKCNVSVKADLSGTMVGNLQKGDLFITLSADGYEGFSGVESFDFGDTASKPNVTIEGTSPDAKTGTVTFTGSGTIDVKNSVSRTIKAKVWLVNSYSKSQNYLSGKDLTLQLTTQVADCTTTSTAGE